MFNDEVSGQRKLILTGKITGKAVRIIPNVILPLCQFCLADCQKALCIQAYPYTRRIWPWDLLDLLLAENFILLPHLAASRTICFLSKFTYPPGYTSCWFFLFWGKQEETILTLFTPNTFFQLKLIILWLLSLSIFHDIQVTSQKYCYSI